MTVHASEVIVTTSAGLHCSYGPVSVSAQASLNVCDATMVMDSHSRNHTMATTRKASARSRQEHRTFFKVASAAGTEDQEVKRIANLYAYAEIRAHGEIIQFLHHALEWEGMAYFLYPYFWSN